MRTRFILFVCILLISSLAAGCIRGEETPTGPPPATDTSPPPPPTETSPPPTTESPQATEPPTSEPPPTEPSGPEPLPPEPQRIEFQAEDGTPLVGEYFPAGVNPAPALILMHQMGSNRKVWQDLGMVSWLTNRSMGGGGLFSPLPQSDLWPPMPGGLSFAVFAFDFRTHGESGGVVNERSDFLMDAKAALETVKSLPGVDPQRIALIGASIGADAAVDVCVEGCLGGLSLSPGSFLEVSYPEVVAEMALDAKPAWCIANQGDSHSAQTCESASGDTYRKIIYPDSAHGTNMLVPGLDPEVGQVILDFLRLVYNIPD